MAKRAKPRHLPVMALALGAVLMASPLAFSLQELASRSNNTDAVVGFDPGMIISDEVFYNADAMDAPAIQQFLDQMGAACVPGTAEDGEGNLVTIPCLKDYAMPIPDVPADEYCAGDIAGTESDTSAAIINKVAKACQINPQVLLVTLQKEQGLVTASGSYLQPRRYRSAMGYACPDTAECDAKYFGFFNQVYNAAHRFQYYRVHPEKFRHQPGRMNKLLFHPSRDEEGNYLCGTKEVFIENQATAGLYNYTPYTPNPAALASGGGIGDECSSYGNRNFYRFFTSWFGSPGISPSRIASMRVSGEDRMQTAVGIAARSFPGHSDRVYLARADNPVDALAGGSLLDGPVLLVPNGGPIPAAVRDTITRLGASQVVGLGGPAALSDQTLADAAQGILGTQRLFGINREATAIAIAHHVFTPGQPVEELYVAEALGPDGKGSADAVVSGMLAKGPVLLVNPRNEASIELVAQEIERFAPGRVVALGGEKVLPQPLLERLAQGKDTARLAGADRYGTALAVASYAYPLPAVASGGGAPVLSDKVAYLARGDKFADALVAGGLSDGPLLLTPPCGQGLAAGSSDYLAQLHPMAVIALGGFEATCGHTVDDALKAVKSGL